MPAKIIEIYPSAKIPEGTYDGIWGGYEVTFKVADTTYKAKTDIGIRTPAAPCYVISKKGQLTVET